MQHALFLGRQTAAPVHRLQVQPLQAPPSPPLPASPGIVEHFVVAHADPAVAILEAAQVRRAGLLAVGAHGDRGESVFLSQGLGRPFLGRTAEQIIRHATCSVLAVRPDAGGAPARVRRILVAVDGSRLAEEAARWAQLLAVAYEAQMEFLHVVEREEGHAEGQAREAVSEALDRLSPTQVPRLHVLSGRPARAICTFARRQRIDLVIQGAHSGEGSVLGRVAAEVVRAVGCAVLTVRQAPGIDTELASQAPHVRPASVG